MGFDGSVNGDTLNVLRIPKIRHSLKELRHIFQACTINTKKNAEHLLTHLLSTREYKHRRQKVVATTSKLRYSSHQAAFSYGKVYKVRLKN